jgi:hypothetical protein
MAINQLAHQLVNKVKTDWRSFNAVGLKKYLLEQAIQTLGLLLDLQRSIAQNVRMGVVEVNQLLGP